MIDYTEPEVPFYFHPDEAELMLYASTGGDVSQLTDEQQEDLEILVLCFTEWTLGLDTNPTYAT